MVKEIVKYNNKLNMISFKELNKLDSDIFFSIIARLKEKGAEKVTISFSELVSHMPKNISNKSILEILDSSTNKLASSIIRYETKSTISKFAIFQLFEINRDNFKIIAQISEPFLFLLNNLETGFTAFELAEFSSLASKYTQTLYRLLKQFKITGYMLIEWSEFLEIMNVPKSYDMGSIDRQILKPSIKELSQEPTLFTPNNPIFKKLKCKKIRGNGRGRPVEKIEFQFLPQIKDTDKLDQAKKDLHYLTIRNKQKHMLQQLKRERKQSKILETKTNPLTCQAVSILNAYIGQYVSIIDIKTQMYNRLKINDLIEDCGRIKAKVYNPDDNYTNEMLFENLEHFKSFFEKYKS